MSAQRVGERFRQLLDNLTLTDDQKADGTTKHQGVRGCLNRWYYNTQSDTANSKLVGSWGKGTRIRPPRDIDVMFVLPNEVYWRLDKRTGNKQSLLLQEVKSVLETTYTTTTMRGDGQVVVVPFSSYAVEIVPAFALPNGRFRICDTNAGGAYRDVDPTAEAAAVSTSNDATSNNTRDLVRMMKAWQSWCSVPLKSFLIELLAIEFLSSWSYRGRGTVYYDWMTRDFLKFLLSKVNGYVFAPGTFEILWLGNSWTTRGETAHSRAEKACQLEDSYPCLAGTEWQKIFGLDIPTC